MMLPIVFLHASLTVSYGYISVDCGQICISFEDMYKIETN